MTPPVTRVSQCAATMADQHGHAMRMQRTEASRQLAHAVAEAVATAEATAEAEASAGGPKMGGWVIRDVRFLCHLPDPTLAEMAKSLGGGVGLQRP